MGRDKNEINAGQPEGKKKKKRTALKVTLIVALVILAAGLFYVGRLLYFAINPLAAFETSRETESVPPPSPSPTAAQTPSRVETEPEPSPTPSVDPDEVMLSQADKEMLKKEFVSILLVGVDEDLDRQKTREGFRSDVMLLVAIRVKDRTVHMLSIPRDSYAPIYKTKNRWKINASFMLGGGFEGNGFEYTVRTVSNLLGGITIDGYVGVQMTGLKNLIDALGGMDYEVDVPVKMNGRVLEKGMQHLTGQQVLDYVRARKGIGNGTDIGRTGRQQKLLIALFGQLQSEDKLTLLPRLVTAMKDEIHTKLTIEQVIALVSLALDVNTEDIVQHALKGEYIQAYNAKYYVLDQTSLKKIVKEIYGISIKTNSRYDNDYVKADAAASNAIAAGEALKKKYKDEITQEQTERIDKMIAKVRAQQKKLPSGITTLNSLAKQLNSLCYKVEKEIKTAPKPEPSSEPEPSPAEGA